jgi:hypothetical protein
MIKGGHHADRQIDDQGTRADHVVALVDRVVDHTDRDHFEESGSDFAPVVRFLYIHMKPQRPFLPANPTVVLYQTGSAIVALIKYNNSTNSLSHNYSAHTKCILLLSGDC